MNCHFDNNDVWIDATGLPTDETEPRVLAAIAGEERRGPMSDDDRELCDRWIARRIESLRNVYRKNPHINTAGEFFKWDKYNGLCSELTGDTEADLVFLMARGWDISLAASRVGVDRKTAKRILENQ